jgi:hypothetical protein
MTGVMAPRREDPDGWRGSPAGLDREELRGRIAELLSSGSLAERVRMRLEERANGTLAAEAGDVVEAGHAALADLFHRFVDDSDGRVGPPLQPDRYWKEKPLCSRI